MMTGKEALIALANGEDVEWRHPEREWFKAPKTNMNTCHFFSSIYEFRLNPRAITINGIEVPARGDDYKPHTFMFVLNSLEPCEYSKIILDESDEIPFYWWESEEEIKQVVAALRSVFK